MSDHLGYNEFIQSFKSQAQELEDGLSGAESLDAKVIDQLSVRITKLRSTVTEAVGLGILPAYDQRLCEQRVASLEDSLAKARAASRPKGRFSFKSSRPISTPPTTETPKTEFARVENPHEDSTTKIVLSDHTGKLLTFSDAVGLESFTGTNSMRSVVVTIDRLADCFVDLTSTGSFTVNALHVQGLERTVLFVGNIQGSIILHGCIGCTIIASAHQFRMHTSSMTNVYLKISSNPIVEKCRDVRFGAFPVMNGADDAVDVPPEKDGNRLPYVVQDFDWMGNGQSPNWSPIAVPFRLPISVSNENLSSSLDQLLPKLTLE